jgi:hypothetical protein
MAYQEKRLLRHSLYVAKDPRVFHRVFGGIALGLLRYKEVEPGDYLEIGIKRMREVRPTHQAKARAG